MPRRRSGQPARLPAILAGLAAVAASVAWLPASASARDPVDDARARLQAAQAEAAAAADRYERTIAEREQTERDMARLEEEIAALEAEIVVVENQTRMLRAQRSDLREVVEQRAVQLYKTGDPADWFTAVQDGEDAGRRRLLGQAAIDADLALTEILQTLTEQLEQTRGDLDVQRRDRDARRTELDRRQAELDALADDLESRRAEFEAKVAEANAALDKAKALGSLLASGTPVMGSSVLNAADLAGWYRTTDSRSQLADGLTIDELATIFVDEGAAEGVRGDVAFAQAYLETGGFSFPSGGQVSAGDNNFSGLGACDSCATGDRFPTARDGVRAQIQHLRNYADETSTAAGLANPPSPYWYGDDPGTAARNFDTFFAKGWAPIWEMMGNGNWATDPGYSGKVLRLYEQMGAYAVGD